jgi:glycosyltransferase involved in cell wall biosynthesis
MTRLLYILPGLVPPSSDPALDKFTFLSEIAEGEVLLPVWWDSPKNVSPFLRETFPIYRVGEFCYHLFLSERFPKPLRRLANFLFYVRRGLQLHRKEKFDAIMVYGTNMPGIAGMILKWILGAPLIVEIPGVPEHAFQYVVPRPGIRTSMKRFVADRLLGFVCGAADCIKLLYPLQLQSYPRLRDRKAVVFHDFVPLHVISPGQSDERFILLSGYPWYTKGVDVLIRAFHSIAGQFPGYKLKLMGHYPDREYLNQLAAGCPQIEFLSPRQYEDALKVIGNCSIYVLASRSEAMGRVLLEAMAAERPIIASAVGGVPYYIQDEDNGLLFESGNVEQLAAKLTTLLSDPELQARLASRAYEKAFSEYDEQSYVRSFDMMLQSLPGESFRADKAIDRYEETMAANKTSQP